MNWHQNVISNTEQSCNLAVSGILYRDHCQVSSQMSFSPTGFLRFRSTKTGRFLILLDSSRDWAPTWFWLSEPKNLLLAALQRAHGNLYLRCWPLGECCGFWHFKYPLDILQFLLNHLLIMCIAWLPMTMMKWTLPFRKSWENLSPCIVKTCSVIRVFGCWLIWKWPEPTIPERLQKPVSFQFSFTLRKC